MNFGEQIKSVRRASKLTQEQMADRLNVSYKAVSDWENNRSLPDIETVFTIAAVFNLSLDQLVSGDGAENSMREKLIRDGADSARSRLNTISVCIGATLLLIGVALIALNSLSFDYIGSSEVLRDNFFLLPVAALFLFGGFMTFLVVGGKNLVMLYRDNSFHGKINRITIVGVCMSAVLLCIGAFLILFAVNNGISTAMPGAALMFCGVLSFIVSVCNGVSFHGKTKH